MLGVSPREGDKRARGSKGRKRGEILGEVAASSPSHQLVGLEERCKLPQRGPGGKF